MNVFVNKAAVVSDVYVHCSFSSTEFKSVFLLAVQCLAVLFIVGLRETFSALLLIH